MRCLNVTLRLRSIGGSKGLIDTKMCIKSPNHLSDITTPAIGSKNLRKSRDIQINIFRKKLGSGNSQKNENNGFSISIPAPFAAKAKARRITKNTILFP